jgi:hypothetical protein
VFFEPAAVHHDKQAGVSCTNGCLFVADSFLHPDGFGAMSNRCFDDGKNVFGFPEDIHEINGARHGGE